MKQTITKTQPVTPQQVKALHAQFSKLGFSDDDRHGFLNTFTDGRTHSTACLTKAEAAALLARLSSDGEDRIRRRARALVKQIFGLSFKISCLNRGYSNDTPEEFEMNKAKINRFCRTRSKFRKNLTEMSLDELRDVKLQFEAMARKEEQDD